MKETHSLFVRSGLNKKRIYQSKSLWEGSLFIRSDIHGKTDLVTLRGAQAHAAFQGRHQINDQDIVLAAELALPHRIKSRPFQEVAINTYELEERLEEAQGDWEKSDTGEQVEDSGESAEGKKKP